MVAALFALHPLRVESVAWVAERKDVLSACFWLATLWAYVWYVEGPSLKRYLLVLLAYAAGLLAKPMLVTLPLVLLLLDWWPLGRLAPAPEAGKRAAKIKPRPGPTRTLTYLALEKLPLLALAALSSLITLLAQQQALVSLGGISFSRRLINAVWAYVNYLEKMLWPTHLAIFYPYPAAPLAWWLVAVACLGLLGCSCLALAAARRRPYLAVGWFWFLGALVPVIGLVQVGSQSMADRYTYIPLLGLLVLVVWGARDLTARWAHQKAILGAAAGIVLAACALLTWQQVGYWRDSISLFQHAIEVTDNNYLAYTKLGVAYVRLGRPDQAVPLYQKAITIQPDYAVPYNNLGLVYADQGKFSEAIELYEKSIKIAPNYADPYNNLGSAYTNSGELDKAVAAFQQAIQLKPNYAEAYYNWGSLYLNQGRFDAAIPVLQQALKINPTLAEAYNNLALALANQGNFDEAISLFQQALALKPQFSAPYNNLAILFIKQGKTPEAIALLRQALQINPANTVAQGLLHKLTDTH